MPGRMQSFAQYGVIRVQDYDELLETAHLLAHTPEPLVPGSLGRGECA
jgi:acyl-CoA synthetase (NDP forming)